MLTCEQVKGSGEEPGVAVDGREYVMGPWCATRRAACARATLMQCAVSVCRSIYRRAVLE